VKRELVLRIGGREVALVASRDGHSIILERGDQQYTIEVVGDRMAGVVVEPAPHAAPASPSTGIPIPTASPSRSPGGPGSTVPSTGSVSSPMTGVVDQVLVKEGSQVSEGEKVVILEAMKMYIDVTAPVSGTVSGVAVAPGDNVKEGQALLTIG
jgi:biotin carboxyl carrier protein